MHSSSFYHFTFIDKFYDFPVLYVGDKKWFYVVVNYQANESRMEVYYDGEKRFIATGGHPHSFASGNDVVQIGRRYTDIDDNYSSMEADDLLSFNTSLSQSDIAAICDRY